MIMYCMDFKLGKEYQDLACDNISLRTNFTQRGESTKSLKNTRRLLKISMLHT